MSKLVKKLNKKELRKLVNQYEESFRKIKELAKIGTTLRRINKEHNKLYLEIRKGLRKESHKIYLLESELYEL